MTTEQTKTEAKEINVHELLKRSRQIAVIWSTEDVQQVRPDLTDDQAWTVLEAVESCHDCNDGICWVTLETVADDLYPLS